MHEEICKINVLLLIPPASQRLVMERDKDVNDAFGTYPPVGLLYIGTYLRSKIDDLVNIKIVDCSIGDWDFNKLEFLINDFNPNIIGLTAFTPSILDVKVTLQIIKKINKECITVIGGPHVTSFQELSFTQDEIDYAIMGYGEYSFYKLINALYFGGDIKEVPGLIYRKSGELIKNRLNDDAVPLDDLPFPDLTFVEYNKYRCPVGTQEVMASIVSSRGCPYLCSFCNSPDKKYKARSITNIIEEIKYLQKLGINEFFFADDLFNITKERVLLFCEELGKNNIKITWSFKSRVSNIDENLIKTVKKYGCERIHFGIESHTDASLKQLKKGITVEQIKNAINLCYKFKINSVGSFMINLPGDTVELIKERFIFANSLKLDYYQLAILVAFNHTQIFNDGIREGLWDENIWLDFVQNPTQDFIAPIWDNGISREKLDKLMKKGLKSFYFRFFYIYQRLRNLHSINEFKKYVSGFFRLLKF